MGMIFINHTNWNYFTEDHLFLSLINIESILIVRKIRTYRDVTIQKSTEGWNPGLNSN